MDGIRYTLVPSPLGEILIAGDAEGLRRIVFQEGDDPLHPPRDWTRSDEDSLLMKAQHQIGEYFDRRRRTFDLKLMPEGTPFQLRVWRELTQIPYGRTISYAELARGIGRPSASRAVGAANGRNPLPIVIPCHRVIGASGKLTGYHGGLHLKTGLLELEGAELPTPSAQPAFL